MERKRLYGLLLLGMVVLLISTTFVSAVTFREAVVNPLARMLTDWTQGDISDTVAKYVLWILLSLLIYAILDNVPVIKRQGQGIKIIIAFLVGFLSTAYLSVGEVHLLLASYGALGFVLGAVLPFIILVFFSMEIHKEGGAGGRIISKAMWFGFILYLIYKLIAGIFFFEKVATGPQTGISTGEGVVYLVTILAAGAYAWFGEKVFLKSLVKAEAVEAAETMEETSQAKLAAKIALADAEITGFTAGGGDRTGKIYKDLAKAYNNLIADYNSRTGTEAYAKKQVDFTTKA